MDSPLFRTQSFPVEGSDKIACIITGYGGKIARYKTVVQTLNKRGFTVIGYEHSPSVLTNYDPQGVINLLDGICNDLTEKATGYKKIICIGVSAGAGLCLALQRRMPAIQYGVYAGAGEPGEDVLEGHSFISCAKSLTNTALAQAKSKACGRNSISRPISLLSKPCLL